jgi:hypothetical protein
MSITSDGSTASYYELPEGAKELQDLISHRNMNAQDGEIFRAVYRKGLASHSDELRDAKKVLFYAQAEVKRLEKKTPATKPPVPMHPPAPYPAPAAKCTCNSTVSGEHDHNCALWVKPACNCGAPAIPGAPHASWCASLTR